MATTRVVNKKIGGKNYQVNQIKADEVGLTREQANSISRTTRERAKQGYIRRIKDADLGGQLANVVSPEMPSYQDMKNKYSDMYRPDYAGMLAEHDTILNKDLSKNKYSKLSDKELSDKLGSSGNLWDRTKYLAKNKVVEDDGKPSLLKRTMDLAKNKVVEDDSEERKEDLRQLKDVQTSRQFDDIKKATNVIAKNKDVEKLVASVSELNQLRQRGQMNSYGATKLSQEGKAANEQLLSMGYSVKDIADMTDAYQRTQNYVNTQNMVREKYNDVQNGGAWNALFEGVKNRAVGLSTSVGNLEAVNRAIDGRPIDVNSGYYQAQNYVQAGRLARTDKINNSAIPMKDAVNFAMDAGASAVDSYLGSALMGGAGLANMALGAASQGTQESFRKYGQNDKAIMMGGLQGVTEAITEKIPMDNMVDALFAKGGKTAVNSLLENVVKQVGLEGAEEGIGDVINTIGDQLINGDLSELSMAVKQYMDEGMSEADAKRKAGMDYFKTVMLDVLAGGLSGGLSMGATAPVQRINTSRYGSQMVARSGSSVEDYANRASQYTNDATVLKALNAYTDKKNGYNTGRLIAAVNQYEEANGITPTVGENEFTEKVVKKASETNEKRKAKAVEDNTADIEVNTEDVVNPYSNRDIEDVKSDYDHAKALNNIKNGLSTEKVAEGYRDIMQYGTEEEKRSAEQFLEVAKTSYKYNPKLTWDQATFDRIVSDATTKEDAFNMGLRGEEIDHTTLKPSLQVPYFQGLEARNDAKYAQIAEKALGNNVKDRASLSKATSEDGTAYDIKGIESVGDTPMLKTSNGTVSLDSMNFESEAVATLYNKASEYKNVDTANLFLNGYKGGTNVNTYARHFEMVLTAGEMNDSTALTRLKAMSGSFDGNTFKEVFEHGRQRAEGRRVDKLVKRGTAKTGKGRLVDEHLTKKPNKAVSNFLTAVAERTGVDVVLTEDSALLKGGKGHFDVRMEQIVLDSSKADEDIFKTAMHELTEFMRTYNDEDMQKVNDLMLEWGAKQLGNGSLQSVAKAYQDAYNDHYAKYGMEKQELLAEASEELVNDMVFTLLTDESNMESFINFLYEGRSTEEGNRLLKSFSNFLNAIIGKVRQMMGRYNPDMFQDTKHIMDTYNNALEKAIKNYQEYRVDGRSKTVDINKGDGITTDADGNSYTDGDIRLSIETYDNSGRDLLLSWLDTQDIDASEKDNIIDAMDQARDIAKRYADSDELIDFSSWSETDVIRRADGSPIFSVVVNNGEYDLNIDFSTICKKRKALNNVLNALIRSGDLNSYTLSQKDIGTINNIIKEHGFEIACALCFVDSKRYRSGAWAQSFADMYNGLVDSLVPEGMSADDFNFTKRGIDNPTENLIKNAKDEELNWDHIDDVMAHNSTSKAIYRMAKAIKENPHLRSRVTSSELLASSGLDAIKKNNAELYELVNSHQGSAKPKLSHNETPYGNEIILSDKFTKEKAYSVGGVRMQSFSDYMANMFFDYVQMFGDLAAKELPAHAYTKESDFVKLFGLNGTKINMSLVPRGAVLSDEQLRDFNRLRYGKIKDKAEKAEVKKAFDKLKKTAGLDADGNYIWEDETFPVDEAFSLRKQNGYDKNCGIIAVGISDAHIEKLLNDPEIDMVIPYHKSSINPVIAKMRNIDFYNDYTRFQNTRLRDANGKIRKAQDKTVKKVFDFYADLKQTNDPKQTAQNYLDICKEMGWIPKFDKFAYRADGTMNPNYYKLLADFRLYDGDGNYAPQGAVTMTMPEGYGDKGGILQQSLEKAQETASKMDADMESLIADIRKELKLKPSNEDARFSVDVDSLGNKLSEGQKEYFKDSKAVDENGNLEVVYHASNDFGFTVFDRNKSNDKRSLFFTNNKGMSQTYTDNKDNVYEVYLNLKNPLEVDAKGSKWNNIIELNEINDPIVADLYEYSRIMQTYDEAIDASFVRENLGELSFSLDYILEEEETPWSESDVSKLKELAERLDGAFENWDEDEHLDEDEYPMSIEDYLYDNSPKTYTTRELAKRAEAEGYDGVIIRNVVDNGKYKTDTIHQGDVMIAFNSNQVKLTSNTNPTVDDDIRYSIDAPSLENLRQSVEDEGGYISWDDADAMNYDAFWQGTDDVIPTTVDEATNLLDEGVKSLNNASISRTEVRKIARKVLENNGSKYDVEQFTDKLEKLFGYMEQYKQINYNDLLRVASEICKDAVAEIGFYDPTEVEVYNDFKKFVKATPIKLSEAQRADVAHLYDGLSKFKTLANTHMNFSEKNGVYLDTIWSELVEASGYTLDADANATNMPRVLLEYMDSIKPQRQTAQNMNENEMALDMALQLFTKYFDYNNNKRIKDDLIRSRESLEKKIERKYKRRLANLEKEMVETVSKAWEMTAEVYDMDADNKSLREKNRDLRSANAELKRENKALNTRNRNQDRAEESQEKARLKRVNADYRKQLREKAEVIARLKAVNNVTASWAVAEERDRVDSRKKSANIKKNVSELQTWLTKPSTANRHYVPDALKQATLEMISSLDMLSVYTRGEEAGQIKDTKENQKWATKMQAVYNMISVQSEVSELIRNEMDHDVIDEMNQFLKDYANTPINMLSSDGLTKLDRIVRHYKTSIMKMNDFHANKRYEGVASLSNSVMRHLKDTYLKDYNNPRNKVLKGIKNLLKWDMADIYTVSKVIGGGFESITESFREGFDKRVYHIADAQTYMQNAIEEVFEGDKKVFEDMNRTVTYKAEGGTVQMSVRQIMGLYETFKRGQGRQHVLVGGIMPTTVGKGKNKVQGRITPVRLTLTDVDNLLGNLTDKEKALADKMQRFMATECADWGNEVTSEWYGYTKFTESEYYPIKSDSNVSRTGDSNNGTQTSSGFYDIQSSGFTKNLTDNATSPIAIDDIFTVFASHVTDMATYNAYALPISDAMKFYNFKETAVSPGKTERNDYAVKRELERALGAESKQYFENFIRSVNGEKTNEAASGLTDLTISAYKGAAIGGNIRVAVQQPTAIARATMVLKGKNVLAGLSGNPFKNMKEAEKWCGIAQWKSWGYFDTGLGQSMQTVITGETTIIDEIKDKSSILAAMGDNVTWGYLWNACKIETNEKISNGELKLEKGTDDYFKEVARLMSKVVDETQVVDSILHRSQVMKSHDMLHKLQTAFMSEPTKSYNMMYRALLDGKKEFGKSVGVFMGTALLTSIAAGLVDALRDDREYDYKYWQRWLKAIGIDVKADTLKDFVHSMMGGNFVDNVNPLNMVPLAKDIMSMINGYDVSRMDMDGVSSCVKAYQDVVDYINGAEDRRTAYGLVKSLVKASSKLTGMPVYNIMRDVESFIETGSRHKFAEDEKTLAYQLMDDAKKARYEGDEKAYQKAIDKLVGLKWTTTKHNAVKDEKEAVSQVQGSIKSSYKYDGASAEDTKKALEGTGMSDDSTAEFMKNSVLDAYKSSGDNHISITQAQKMLKDLGYNDKKIQELLVKAVESQVNDRIYGKDYGSKELKDIGMEKNAIDLAFRDNEIASLKKAYQDGRFSEAEVKSKLKALNMSDKDITKWFANTATKSLKEGEYTEKEAYDNLRKLGLTDAEADKNMITTIKAMYQNGDYTETEVKKLLKQYGMTDDEVSDYISYQKSYEIKDSYEAGYMSRNEAYNKLRSAGMTDYSAFLELEKVDNGGKYDRVADAVVNSDNWQSVVDEYLSYNVGASYISSNISDDLKSKYLELYNTNKTAAAEMQQKIIGVKWYLYTKKCEEEDKKPQAYNRWYKGRLKDIQKWTTE